jgi:hypothetical protein
MEVFVGADVGEGVDVLIVELVKLKDNLEHVTQVRIKIQIQIGAAAIPRRRLFQIHG